VSIGTSSHLLEILSNPESAMLTRCRRSLDFALVLSQGKHKQLSMYLH
jgi:hypothetical protein